jgi:Asp-tRNA(Asn)/Glu-tRNA(Gln) amidotransferase A subunit family amidase
MTDLTRLTATEAVRSMAAGRFTAGDLVRACLARIAERESEVQAWAHCDPDGAIAQARAVDSRGAGGLLFGVPIGVKDVIDAAGMPTQCNSPIYRDYRPKSDAACVALARRAGAVILGKTVTTEFASRSPGPTRHPLDAGHTPGGSSSGSAAAVADFMVPLAFGTQTGGSTIRPAAYCGIVGYKPSFGTINCAGMKHLAESLDTIGVLGRSVADCALLVHVASSRPLPDFSRRPERAPRIGYCRTSRWEGASPATQARLEEVASRLAGRGAAVHEIVLPADFDRLYDLQPLIMNYEAARALAWEYDHHAEELSEHMRAMLPKYSAMPHETYAEAIAHARACRRQFTDLLAEFDTLLTPSAPDEAPEGLASTGSSLFNRNWTLLRVPCVTVPAGRGPRGLPLGVQLVGARDTDARLLQCAAWVAEAIG